MLQTNPYTVYSASAGSGKTFTLVKEYLQILFINKDVFHFKKVLAITFTNKAAAEMKDRVVHTLQTLARGKETELLQPIIEATSLEKSYIHKKAKLLIEAILQDYTSFNITTIDSFTHRIIRSFAYDFGLSLSFEIEMDAKKVLQEAVDTVIAQIGKDTKLTKALISFSHQRSKEDKAWDISTSLNQIAGVLLNESDKLAFKSIADKSIDDYTQLQDELNKKSKYLIPKLKEIGKKGLQLIEDSDLEHKDFYRSMLPNHFLALAENWKKAKFYDQSTLRLRIEENTLYSKSKSGEIKEKIENCLPQLLDLYLESEKVFSKLTLVRLFKESLVPLSVLSYVNNALEQYKYDNNIQLISEFNELIFNKIQNEPAPFIYERLGEKFQHFFIDEMQDTSVLQWRNLVKLIENALSQEEGSLMLVGDAKQAIYRWRGGESEQFINLSDKQKEGPFQVSKRVNNLDTNYRSFSEVIHFNNSFFQQIANLMQNASHQELYKEGNTQKINSKIGGYTQIDFIDTAEAKRNEYPDLEVLYPKKVLETIQNLDPSFDLKDVCVLVRKNSQGVMIASYLSEHGISIISSESLLLANNSKIDFLINLLHILWEPKDDLSRYNLLDFLYRKAAFTVDKHQFISERIHLDELEFYTQLQKDGFHFSLNKFYQNTLYDAVEYLLRAFKLIETSDAYIQYFMDVVLDFQIKNGSDLMQFLTYWEQQKEKLSISTPEGVNAVQIMTIHKAKGLQFPVVIFPYDLNMYQQINPTVWYPISEPEKYNNFEKLLVPFKTDIQYTDTVGLDLYNERRELLLLDNYNLLYVTLTRAIEQLYIITEYKISKKSGENTDYYSGLFINYLKSLNKWDANNLHYSFGKKTRVVLADKNEQDELSTTQTIISESFISTDISEHQVSLYAKSSTLWGTEQGEAITYGNLVHDILAHIYTLDDVSTALNLFVNQGTINKTEAKELKKILLQVVKHNQLELYYQHNLKIYNEREIVNEKGVSLIPDRVVVLPNNQVVIIDYKTGAKEKKHQAQVNNYATYWIEMGYDVSKQLLVYIEENNVEVVLVKP